MYRGSNRQVIGKRISLIGKGKWPATTTLPYQRQLDFPINRCYWRLSDLRLKEGFYDYTRPKSEEANGRISEDREVMQGRLGKIRVGP